MAAMKRKSAVTIAAIVAVVLVVALLGAELFVRQRVKSCMAEQFQSQLGSQVDVSLSWKPVLLQLIDKKVPSVTIDSAGDSFGPAKDMQVHAQIKDIHLVDSPDSSGTIGSSNADIAWSTAGMLATVQAQSFGSLVSSVDADPTAGTLKFSVGPAGLAELTVRPQAVGGRVEIHAVDASILGFGLPTGLVDGIVQTLSNGLEQYPLDMQATSLTVTDSGVKTTLAGGQYTMPPADAQHTAAQQPTMQQPTMRNPSLQNPGLRNPLVQNPALRNPTMQNPAVQNTATQATANCGLLS